MENGGKRYKGTVKMFNAERGFGFVRADDGQDFFTHISDWQRAAIPGDPRVGTPITFTLAPGTKGPKVSEIELAK